MIQAAEPRLILASASPARRAVLLAAGLDFTVQPAAVDEATIKRQMLDAGCAAEIVALALADAKASSVADRDALALGADQILVCGETWFDKPHDLADAADHLRALRGQTHRLVTAMVCWHRGVPVWRHVTTPELAMRDISEAFIDAYLAAEGLACLGSVGAYRVEALGVQLFSAVTGEHAAVLGLPLLALLAFLREHGVLLG